MHAFGVVLAGMLGATGACERSSVTAGPDPASRAAAPQALPAAPPAPTASSDGAVGGTVRAGVGLAVGAKAPEAELRTAGNEVVALSSLYKDGPVVVVFIRGGWCPYCTGSLAGWEKKMDDLKAAGASLVVITPEKPDRHEAMTQKHSLHMRVLSDAKMEAARGFGLLFTMDDTTRKTYEGYGIDLAARNTTGTWELPHPGTFVIDRAGVVRYAFAREDYKERAEPAEVMEAVRKSQ
jgi:peroxiredoxin